MAPTACAAGTQVPASLQAFHDDAWHFPANSVTSISVGVSSNNGFYMYMLSAANFALYNAGAAFSCMSRTAIFLTGSFVYTLRLTRTHSLHGFFKRECAHDLFLEDWVHKQRPLCECVAHGGLSLSL